jgi:endogenous inhibitor of DNA gyrase (YacG/DUF329 family)
MRITKHGRPPGDRIWTATCPTCSSEVEAQQHELTLHSCWREDMETATAKCPVCGQMMTWKRTERFESDGGA